MKIPKRLFFGLDVDDPTTESKILIFVLKVWSGFAVLLILILWFDYSKIGVVGDMFGVVNSLFSGLAFAGIIYTILLQREELRAQRSELILTRKELNGQKIEFQTQNITLKRQRFESMFFNMLSIHFNIISETKHLKSINGRTDDIHVFKGIDAFISFNTVFRGKANSIAIEEIADMQSYYEGYYSQHMWYFIPYVNSLVALLRVIKESKFNPEDGAEQRYINVLNSYISLAEKIFLSYLIVLTDDDELRDLDKYLSIVSSMRNAKRIDPMLNMYIDKTQNSYKDNL